MTGRRGAPMPANFTALSSAWDDPTAFARELHQYYRQLETTGDRIPTPNRLGGTDD